MEVEINVKRFRERGAEEEREEDRKRAINVYISCEMSDYRLYKLKAL